MHYRPNFHITPPSGRLNDPNGMFIRDGQLHVFYQHDPSFPARPKRTGWAHTSTPWPPAGQPPRWRHYPNALYPDAAYDAHGCYSGGAVIDGEDLWLFYTGNLKVEEQRIPSQNRVKALLTNTPMGGSFTKDPANPLIPDAPHGFTGHVRDPHITKAGNGNAGWRMVLGAQREDLTPAVALYQSKDLSQWDFMGALEFDTSTAVAGTSPDIIPAGYMWECPNLITMKDQLTGEDLDVLFLCPQGLDPVTSDGVTHYASSDQCGYIVGRLEGTTFTVVRGFSELDYGYEFYAPQIIGEGTAPHSQAVLLGWMGLPAQDDRPTLDEGWVHCLTLPRVVTLAGHVVQQAPAYEIPEVTTPEDGLGCTLVECTPLTGSPTTMRLIDATNTPALTVSWDPATSLLTLRRPGSTPRTVSVTADGDRPIELTMIADGCAVEVFAGKQVAMSSAAFGSPQSQGAWRRIEVTH